MINDWEKAGSKLQLMKLALSVRGVEYIAHSTAEGWGCDPEYISREFQPFNLGRFKYDDEGYTSTLYCQSPDDIHVTSTIALIIDCHKTIHIDRHICELYMVNSDVDVVGGGHGVAYLYNSSIRNNSQASVNIKEDNKYGRI